METKMTQHTPGQLGATDAELQEALDKIDGVYMPATKHTPGPWHVNAIKGNRVVGDETSEGWEKLNINGANCTVARVYRAKDARLIASAPILRDALIGLLAAADAHMPLHAVTARSVARAAIAETV